MHGLSTLNRLLGKKNKEVSRSTTNLSKSHGNLDSSSQHKKINPISNNNAFEQTFRVTVYLPKNQLYVERIGAKTKLEKLMNDVCDSKNLTFDKYEFRHPADMSQAFENDKTIGEIGLNELRLVLKTESRFNSDFHRFHTDDNMMKYRSSNVPDSVSSSEISRSHLKNVSKTSPYSSTNSLNSLDSTGMNSTGKQQQQAPVAPIRKKKRMAPRPPSENSIPEQEIFSSTTLNVFKEPHSILPRKNFHVSSPQLYSNNISGKSDSNNNHTELRSVSSRLNAITRPSTLYVTSTSEVVKNMPERQRNNSESSEIQNILKDTVDSKHSSLERPPKKKSPAPVPPTRLKSNKPTPSPRTTQDDIKQQSITEIKEVDDEHETVMSHVTQQVIEEIPKDNNGNVSKVLLNNTSNGNIDKINNNNSISEGPSSIDTDGSISIQIISTQKTKRDDESSAATVASEKSLPVVSKVHISHHQEFCNDETISQQKKEEIRAVATAAEEEEGEEEEEEEVNIYNVTKSRVVSSEKAAKTVSVLREETKHVVIERNNNVVQQEETTKTVVIQEEQHRNRSPSPEWTYKLPAPPVLNDAIPLVVSSPTDHHRKSINAGATTEKFFDDFTSTADNETILSDSNTTSVTSAETHIQPIINERRKTLDDSFTVDSAVTTTTVDFTKPDSVSDKSATEIITSDLEDGYLGNAAANSNEVSVIESFSSSSTTTPAETNRGAEKEIIVEDFQRSRLIITRSDSFHSIGQQKKSDYELKRTSLNALPQRSTSFLSLNHSHKLEVSMNNRLVNAENVPYNRQKSTSELSISDVPSLQSLEVLKNILNSSRKNSLQDSVNNNTTTATVAATMSASSASMVEKKEAATKVTEKEPQKKREKDDEIKSIEKAYVEELKERYAKKLETQKSEPAPQSINSELSVKKAQEKTSSQWRYSGPPKINFSTWNERPKVEVSVMSDEDYIFGGISNHQQQQPPHQQQSRDSVARNRQIFEKKSETINISRESDRNESTTTSASTTTITGEALKSKEAEKHLPKVLGVEYKKDINPVELRKKPAAVTTTNATSISVRPRPATVDFSSNNSASTNYQGPSSTQFVSYNRLTGNHNKKFTPVVHGFTKLDHISETQADVKSLPIANKLTSVADASEKRAEAPIIPLKPAYLRSTSAGDINRKVKLTPVTIESNNNNDSYDDSPFSQTLRRTGLIEKRLSEDKKTESMFGRVIDTPKNSGVPNNTINNYNNNNTKSINTAHSQVAVEEEKVTIRQHSLPAASAVPPPPPPNPGTFRKSAPIIVGGGEDLDSRNQLLDAIKNFNKDALRRK